MKQRTIKEHCAVCNEIREMAVVQEEDSSPDLVWVQCPECHEIKPVDLSSGRADENKPENHSGPDADTQEKRRTYPGEKEYDIGDTVYHSAWKDNGTVVEKRYSRGGRLMIVVEFEKTGIRKLTI